MSDSRDQEPGNIGPSQERVTLELLRRGEKAPTLRSLIDLFNEKPDLIFKLAIIGVIPSAPSWVASLADLARQLKSTAAGTTPEFVTGPTGASELRLNGTSLSAEGIDPEEVRQFLRGL